MNFFFSFLQIIRDLLIRFFPFSVGYDYRFAFLIHARDITDMYRKFPFARRLPKKMIEWYCKYSWPITISKVTGLKSLKNDKEILGCIIGVPMTAHQMLENRNLAIYRIIQACKLAEKLGVRIIGLGALTSSVTGGGTLLRGNIKTGITTGHALTSFMVTSSVLDIIGLLDLDKKSVSVAIIGAAGSIGSTSAYLLARKGIKKMLLVDLERKNPKLRKVINNLKEMSSEIEISVSHQIGDIKECQLIITATSAPEVLIKSGDLRPGAIIIDDAQPSDVSPDIIKERDDVMIIDGGIINTPGVFSNFNFSLANRDDNYSCLGEVMCLSVINWSGDYNIGLTNLDKVEEIKKIAESINFKRGDFQNSGKVYSSQDIERIKAIIKKDVRI